jgi:sugar phosphate isomerase/epimerase
MMASSIALQMYTLRAFTKTPADIVKTMARVKKIGYDAVQLSALGPIDANELANILKNEGLAVAATHISLDRLKAETQKIIDDLKTWGCELTAIGGFWPKEWSEQAWTDFIADYSKYAKEMAAQGVYLGYHNHNHEMAKAGKAVALKRVLEESDKSVWMEIDTYWITAGGGDPAAWVRMCKGRIPAIHLKDMGIKSADRSQFMMEVGEGNLNFPEIIKACKEAGTKWHIIEQDECYRDPFESVEISLKNLKGMGVV